jgi:hypothetical protein
MRSKRCQLVARTMGSALGLGLAAAIVLASWPAANANGLTATVRFSVPPSGELAVTPTSPRPVLVAAGLRPGSTPAVSSFEVQNQTASPMALRFRAQPNSTALDGLLQVRLSSGRLTLSRTSLQGLLQGSATPLQLPAGASQRVLLEAWMPSTVGDGYEGRLIDVSLDPLSGGG